MKYSELLEQQPATTPSPDVAPNAPENGPETLPKNPDLGELQGEVKLEQLDGKINPSAYEILQANGTNLVQFLQQGKSPERLEGLVNNLEAIFQKVGVDYCHLDSGEAKHMATGIVCSIIDSLTGERNTGNTQPVQQPAEGDKTKSAANPFGARGDVFGNVSKMFGGKESSGVENALGGMFNQLIGVFGGADVLWQRLKSIFLLIELTRKSREILCPRGTDGKPDPKLSAGTWDASLIHDPKLFVGSSRIVEMAIKADKDLIQPENIHTLADFQKAIQITQGATTVRYGLLDLLGLRKQSTSALPIAAKEYFADIDQATLQTAASTPEAKQKLATQVLDGLEAAVKQGESLQDGWSKNRTTLEAGELRGKVKEWMDALAPLSDPNDPDSLYSTFNKRVNLICGLLTGTAFSEDSYDPKAKDLGTGLTDGSALSGEERTKVTDGVLEGVAVGGVLYHATNVILKGESAYQYDAINPSDSNDQQLSIGLMQWHGPRAGELIAKMGESSPEVVLDPAKGLGPEFGTFVLKTKPNGRWLEIPKRGTMVDNKRVPNELEEDGTPLAEWKKNWIVLMKQLLGSDLAKQVMNNQLKTDVESYVPEVKQALGITTADNELSLEEKKAIVMGCRFYNAGPKWTTDLLSGLPKPVTIEAIKDAALANPWNTEPGLIAGVKRSIQQTYEYCVAIS